jgi:antitoxin Phd
MQHTWQIQEAKNRFSELVDLSLSEGPQIVTRHGKPVVQIVPIVPIVQKASVDQADERTNGPQTDFGRHLMLLRHLPPGPALELPERNSRRAPINFED